MATLFFPPLPLLLRQGVVRGLTQDLDDATKADALAALKQVLSDHATDDGVLLGAATWIITARVSR